MRTITDQLREERQDYDESETFYWNPERHGRLVRPPRTLKVLPDLDTDNGDVLPRELEGVL